jgi:hypothetical protein
MYVNEVGGHRMKLMYRNIEKTQVEEQRDINFNEGTVFRIAEDKVKFDGT